MGEGRQENRGGVLRSGDRTPDWPQLEGRTPFGDLEVGLDVAGLRVRLRGLSASQAEWFHGRYGIFATEGLKGRPHIGVEVRDGPAEGFLQLDQTGKSEIYRLATRYKGSRLCSWSYRFAGWFEREAGIGSLAICDEAGRGFESSLENYLRVAYSTLALGQGGFLLHSAGIVRDGRAYLLFGPSGSGKTTACSYSPGARVLSDDLTLVVNGAGTAPGPRAVSIPFRGHHAELPPAQESFPVVGFYRLIKDEKVFVEPLDAARGVSEVIGSLPFVTECRENGEAILSAVGRALADAPAYRLHLRKDPTFWRTIEDDSAGGKAATGARRTE